MRDEMFADPWLDARPRPDSAEPELGLRSAPRSPHALSGTENAGHRGLSSPPDPVPRRAPMTSAALPVGSLLYLVLVGLVAAATIGVFFGAGFLSLVHPGTETAADTDANGRDLSRPYSDAPRADRKDPPPPRESAAPDSAAVAAPPGSPSPGQRQRLRSRNHGRARRRKTPRRGPPTASRSPGRAWSPSRHQAPLAYRLPRCPWRARQTYRLLAPQNARRPVADEVITGKLDPDIGINEPATASRP